MHVFSPRSLAALLAAALPLTAWPGEQETTSPGLAAAEPAAQASVESGALQASPAAAPGVAAAEPAAEAPVDSVARQATPAAAPAPAPIRLPQVSITGVRPQDVEAIPGSLTTLGQEILQQTQPTNTLQVMRNIPGVHAQDEEGLGLRPNLGIRGLDPIRSRKVLLLEDGIPLGFAPYGDNAAYYHPPVERMERVEVLKGSGQLLYGPNTVGGVVNYITPAPPLEPHASVSLSGGELGYANSQVRAGTRWGDSAAVLSYSHKRGEGARENTSSRLNDFNLKTLLGVGERQSLTLRASYYQEDSNVTYSGLTQAEWEANPRQNPFENDTFDGRRFGASATHLLELTDAVTLTTNAYGSFFSRDWWRQSSNSSQRPNDASDPNCGGMDNLGTTCGNEGRLRQYLAVGLEPRARWVHRIGPVEGQLDTGVRLHYENQDRMQMNGAFPTSRTGVVVEDNRRQVTALAAFAQERFDFGRFTVTPGLRFESIWMDRTNHLANGGAGTSGESSLSQLIPGIGATALVTDGVTLFAGAHRGFAPPRPEDVINNSNGQVIELRPELSWNYELGARASLSPSLDAELTAFVMDFENLIVPASIAGGEGAALTNGGHTLHAGAEAAVRADTRALWSSAHSLSARAAYTFVPLARFEGTRFSSISGSTTVSVTGNRLPYSPRHTFTGAVGYAHASGFGTHLEAVHVGEMYTDDLNTVEPTPNGQRGVLASHTVFNAGASYRFASLRSTVSLSVKNLLDELYIVDRTRGILPGMPRQIHGGIRTEF